MSDWTNPHQQHDACEFMAYLCGRLRFPDFQGDWQARCDVLGDIQCTDSGSTMQAIRLETPMAPPGLQGQGPIQIQQLIDTWTNQHAIHALRMAPHILCLQLGRFQHTPQQRYKNQDPIMIGSGHVRVPRFTGSDLQRSFVEYRISAGILHHGAFPTTGHYTAWLCAGMHQWLCDDGQAANLITNLPEYVHETVYILLAIKVN